ncbi:N-acyl-D-amino-acid deacylase [Sphingomonas sp. UYAg733]
MKRASIAAAALLLLGAAAPPQFDIVIRHGRVLDGAGNPWVAADIAIKDGRIAQIGQVKGSGAKEIDATGLYVSPGFIDMMDQSGEVLLTSGGAENKLRMGVTTLIAGEGGTPVDAAKIPAYFAQLERQGIAVNFGTYYSAAQARVKVMGDAAGHPSPVQLDAMRSEVATAMRAGVFGIATALIYPPDSFQTTDDLIALAKVSGKCGGFYATHMRDESAKLLSGIDEAIRIGEEGGVKVEIFHLKAAYKPLAGKLMPRALARISAARERGVDVAADLYPYTAGGTGIDITVPNWVFADGLAKGWERLKDPAVRARLKREVAAGSQADWSNLVEASGGWDHVVLANAFDPKYDAFDGQSFAAIGKAMGRDPADVAWDIAGAAQPRRAMALFFMMDDADIDLALKQPWTSIGTDAAASAKFGEVDALGLPHPRAYGTFPRILGFYARDRGLLSLPEAVRKMTSWPAARMGLADRGVLREGLRADLVLFDYAKVAAGSDWKHPVAPPVGIEDVIVNGVLAVTGERATGSRSGMVLRHPC